MTDAVSVRTDGPNWMERPPPNIDVAVAAILSNQMRSVCSTRGNFRVQHIRMGAILRTLVVDFVIRSFKPCKLTTQGSLKWSCLLYKRQAKSWSLLSIPY